VLTDGELIDPDRYMILGEGEAGCCILCTARTVREGADTGCCPVVTKIVVGCCFAGGCIKNCILGGWTAIGTPRD